jgi:GAF domain-containing protein/anti-sigma regulatory factor (Ser/Thr protein kinase)
MTTEEEGTWWATPSELTLTDDPEAIRLARKFVAGHVPAGTLRDDAELIACELLANAYQHGTQPVTVRVLANDDRVRIEVQDGSSRPPVRALVGEQNMTGRGLALVEQLSERWGVRPENGGGKSVWAELTVTTEQPSPDENVDVDSLLASWADDDDSFEELFVVSLGDVPTDLLIAAKAHVDNLVRELSLAAAGAEATGVDVPLHLAELIDTVVHGFGDARVAIKRQAIAAAERGDSRTRLTLHLPLSAANAGEAYLNALDMADSYARAARLLTLETPPQHRVFRRWYVQAVIDQLRAIARGEHVQQPESFEERLLDEIDRLAVAQQVSERSARLQTLTAALARASTPEEVASVVVSEGVNALGAAGGSLLVLSADGEQLIAPGVGGYRGDRRGQRLVEQVDAPLPAATALREGEPIWLESRQERDERFPAMVGLEPTTVSVCVVPLTTAFGQPLGALQFSFDIPRLFDEDERRFVLALAAQTARALERSELNRTEREARAAAEGLATRLTALAGVTAKLAAAHDQATVAAAVVTEAADALEAQIATLFVLSGDELRAVAMRGMRAESELRWANHPLTADLPAAESMRTAKPIAVAGTAAIVDRWPVFAGEIHEERSLVCVPLLTEGRPTGVISLMFAGSRLPDSHEATFLNALADTCAQALHRLDVTAEAEQASARLQFLADASGTLSTSLDYRTTLSRVARLAVPVLADWCAIEMLDESGQLRVIVAEHVDPAKVALAMELQRRYPSDMNAPIGAPNVVRTGVSELIMDITDEMITQATRDPEHLELSLQLQLRSAMVVPLTVRDRVIGTLALFYAESERRYSAGDLPFAEDLAQRAATAIENARLFSETREIAVRLQRALLPELIAPVPGWDIAAHYSPSGEQAEVGGDWYDVIPLRDGRFVAVVGDVMGRGVAAAAAMAQMRSAIRGFATVDPAPELVLQQLDGMFEELEMSQLVTLLYALVDASTGETLLASAGHLPPLLLTPDGGMHDVDLPIGLPLGVRPDNRTATLLQVPAKSTLIVYTDGLVERRDQDLDIQALVRDSGITSETPAQQVLNALTDRAGVSVLHDDDVTLLAARRR